MGICNRKEPEWEWCWETFQGKNRQQVRDEFALSCRKNDQQSFGLRALNHRGKEQENNSDPRTDLWLQLEGCAPFWPRVSAFLLANWNKFTGKLQRTGNLEELAYEKRWREVNLCSLAKQWLSSHASIQKCPQLWARMERSVIQQDAHLANQRWGTEFNKRNV